VFAYASQARAIRRRLHEGRHSGSLDRRYPATVAFPERLEDPRLRADFPAEIHEEVQKSLEHFHALWYVQNMDRIMDFGPTVVRKWVESDAVIGMRTDSGTPMNFHTEPLRREMKLFVDYGITPQRAIAAATRIARRNAAHRVLI